MVTRRKFSRGFKLEAVKLVTQRGVSAPQVAEYPVLRLKRSYEGSTVE
jgi:hypothetical protein